MAEGIIAKTMEEAPLIPETPAPQNEEEKFQAWIKSTPWHDEFTKEWGEAPDLNTKDYDYRKAFKAGIVPSRDKYDTGPNPRTGAAAPEGGRYHWSSAVPETGEMLKSDEHPTAWMEYFMRATGGVEPEPLVRAPSKSEAEFFQTNKNVGGMADFDSGKIVLNPYSTLTAKEKAAVAQNEYTRLMMRKLDVVPEFEITPEQQKAFADYGGGDTAAIKETITARIISGDPSALNVTREQVVAAEKIKEKIEASRGE